jgi:non-ribosomal peptide synthase protein (TIGR01720 family)
MTTIADGLQARLDLEQGPLLRVAYFDPGPDRPGRLLFIAHHLVVDGISWRLLLEDFQTIYQQIEAGQSLQLPAKTTSFRDWATRLSEYAQSNKARAEADYWLALRSAHDSPLPYDFVDGPNDEGSACAIDVALSSDETRALLHDVPPVYRTEINDALLAALGMAINRATASQQLLLNLEGHGREDLIDGVDISRTVGWFTTAFPVVLDLQQAGDPGAMLKAVKENLRGIPNRGFGYGVLRYLSADRAIVERLREQPRPEITFNYLGQLDQALGSSEHFSLATEAVGATRSALSTRPFLLEIDGFIRQDRLHAKWTYSTHHYRSETIERLAAAFMESLREIIAHCQTPGAGGFTPSDFPLAKLEQAQLDRLLEKLKQPKKGRT